MGLKRLADKVDDYKERLKNGKASKIKRSHVEKTLEKLRAKDAALGKEIEETEKDSKKERLKLKQKIAREHITRAEWLLEKLD